MAGVLQFSLGLAILPSKAAAFGFILPTFFLGRERGGGDIDSWFVVNIVVILFFMFCFFVHV